jgi:tetratricopeptide (TPR) repeat protein
MVRDGNYDRAETALERVDPKAEGVDTAQYYTLEGLLAVRRSEFRDAIRNFEAAIENGQENPVINVYLAQAYFGDGQYEQTVETVGRVQNLNQFPELIGIKAQSEWETGDVRGAFTTINRAIPTFPSKHYFQQQKIFFLIELDLNQEAAAESMKYLDKVGDDPNAYLTIGEALRRGGEKERAIRFYEMANLKFPKNERVRLALANAYASNDQPLIAARIVEQAAASNGKLYYEAAELYRRAGVLNRALYLNSLVTDQQKKAVQRFNFLLEMERFEEAMALEKRLDRLGALEEDGMRYAMAYVHFHAQHFDRASEYLNRITSSEYFREATQLRKAIETLRTSGTTYF